jgi:predicted permease
MILRIISIVFPIFILVMIGFAYGRKHRPDMTTANSLNISVFLVTVLQFTVGIWLLSGRFSVAMLWREPLLAAACAGLVVSLTGLTVWSPLLVPVKLLGDISIELMIFALGVRLSSAQWGAWRIGVVGACVTPVSGMLVAWALGLTLPLNPQKQAMLFIFGALPPSVSSFIFAERFKQEPDKEASIVIIGNVMALFFIPLALALWL